MVNAAPVSKNHHHAQNCIEEKMELGTEISQKVKKTIKKQLQTLGSYVDDELPEYIMVMLANKRTREQMIEDLNLFLNDEAEKFVSWLFIVLERIKKAITLSDVDDIKGLSSESDEEPSKKKRKKIKKDEDDSLKNKGDEKDKRQKDNDESEKVKSKSNSNSHKMQFEKQSVNKGKENEKHMQSGERRYSDERERRRRRERNRSDNQKSPCRSKDKQDKGTAWRSRNESLDCEAEEKIDTKKGQKNASPMDFVKRIAKDISKKIIGSPAERSLLLVDETKNVDSETKAEVLNLNNENESESKHNDLAEAGTLVDNNCHGNVSLQAVNQYGDGEIELYKIGKKTEKISNAKESKKTQRTEERYRKLSRSHSRPIRRSRSKGRRSRSRSKSPVYQRRRASPYTKRRSRLMEPKQPVERKRRHSVSEGVKEKVKCKMATGKSIITGIITAHGSRKENMDLQNMSSQVQLITDFKRKPTLGKTHQASAALLKRAMTAVVSDAVDKSKKSEEELELDYSESVGDLHGDRTNMDFSDRKVINLNRKSTGLATITVNFKSKKSATDTDEEINSRVGVNAPGVGSDEEEMELRKGLLQGMSKGDARFAIMKTRLEQKQHLVLSKSESSRLDQRLTTTKNKQSDAKERYIGSMVADLEEKSNLDMKRRKCHERRRDREKVIEKQRHPSSMQKVFNTSAANHNRRRINNKNMSSDEEILSEDKVKQLTEETRRIKMQELQRSMEAAKEGDLRNILKSKHRQPNQHRRRNSSSEDEDEVERKLREKIKEEKHKRLFGQLNLSEMERFQKDRKELRRRLERKQRSRKSNDRHSNRLTESGVGHTKEEKLSQEHRENSKLMRGSDADNDDYNDDDNDDDDDEQWVENVGESTKNLQEIRGECDPEDNSGEDGVGNVESMLAFEGKEQGEKYLEKNESSDEYMTTHEAYEGLQVSAEVLIASVHGGGKLSNEGDEGDRELGCPDGDNIDKKEDEMISSDKKNEKEIIEPEEEKPRKKKTRQEFIVTLDGYEKDKSKETNESDAHRKRKRRASSEKQQHEEHNQRSERMQSSKRPQSSFSFSNSEDDFVEIYAAKPKDKKTKDVGKSHRRRRSSRGQKQNNEAASEEELSQIDKEILLAEKKLKTQKLMKKSLEQVRNLNTDSLRMSIDIDQRKGKTAAFVNPHFKPKVDIPIVNVSPLNVAGQPIAAVQTLNSVIPPVLYPTSQITSYMDTVSLPKKIPQVNIVKPVFNVTTETTTATLVNSSIGEPTIVTSQPQQMHLDQLKTLMCKAFPSCSYGSRCLYLHPPCKFGERCKNVLCMFSHNSTTTQIGICKFYPNCKNASCPYKHVKPCHFGASCKNTDCQFYHETNSRGTLKWVADKPHISERSFAIEDSNVATIPTTSNL